MTEASGAAERSEHRIYGSPGETEIETGEVGGGGGKQEIGLMSSPLFRCG